MIDSLTTISCIHGQNAPKGRCSRVRAAWRRVPQCPPSVSSGPPFGASSSVHLDLITCNSSSNRGDADGFSKITGTSLRAYATPGRPGRGWACKRGRPADLGPRQCRGGRCPHRQDRHAVSARQHGDCLRTSGQSAVAAMRGARRGDRRSETAVYRLRPSRISTHHMQFVVGGGDAAAPTWL